jgi:hypothetical protein
MSTRVHHWTLSWARWIQSTVWCMYVQMWWNCLLRVIWRLRMSASRLARSFCSPGCEVEASWPSIPTSDHKGLVMEQCCFLSVRFGVLMAVTVKVTVVWDLTPCSFVGEYLNSCRYQTGSECYIWHHPMQVYGGLSFRHVSRNVDLFGCHGTLIHSCPYYSKYHILGLKCIHRHLTGSCRR